MDEFCFLCDDADILQHDCEVQASPGEADSPELREIDRA